MLKSCGVSLRVIPSRCVFWRDKKRNKKLCQLITLSGAQVRAIKCAQKYEMFPKFEETFDEKQWLTLMLGNVWFVFRRY